jgi:hypothetical protein
VGVRLVDATTGAPIEGCVVDQRLPTYTAPMLLRLLLELSHKGACLSKLDGGDDYGH